jgi:hypothetical protein
MILSQWQFSDDAKIGNRSAYNPPHMVQLKRIIADIMILVDDNDDGMA